MRRTWQVLLPSVLAAWSALLPPPAHAQNEREAVLAVVNGLFEAMEARDTAAYGRLTMPEARYLAVVDLGDSVQTRWTTNAEFLTLLTGAGPRLVERMWDPQVLISGPLAVVWTPYDFHVGDRFSHCGVDAFHLVHTGDGWRIAEIAYTVVPSADRCTPHPDGPPDLEE